MKAFLKYDDTVLQVFRNYKKLCYNKHNKCYYIIDNNGRCHSYPKKSFKIETRFV